MIIIFIYKLEYDVYSLSVAIYMWNKLLNINKKDMWSNRQIRGTGPRLGDNIAIQENELITNIDPEPLIESNGKNV